jgi:hypothetical protein
MISLADHLRSDRIELSNKSNRDLFQIFQLKKPK